MYEAFNSTSWFLLHILYPLKGGGAVLECDVIYANWDIKITNDDTLNVISIYASEDMNNEKIYEHCDINIQLLYANNQWFSFVVYQ